MACISRSCPMQCYHNMWKNAYIHCLSGPRSLAFELITQATRGQTTGLTSRAAMNLLNSAGYAGGASADCFLPERSHIPVLISSQISRQIYGPAVRPSMERCLALKLLMLRDGEPPKIAVSSFAILAIMHTVVG